MRPQKVRLRVYYHGGARLNPYTYVVRLPNGKIAAIGVAETERRVWRFGFQAAEKVARAEYVRRVRAAE